MVRDASVHPYSLGGRGGRTSVANDCGGSNAANRSAALARDSRSMVRPAGREGGQNCNFHP